MSPKAGQTAGLKLFVGGLGVTFLYFKKIYIVFPLATPGPLTSIPLF